MSVSDNNEPIIIDLNKLDGAELGNLLEFLTDPSGYFKNHTTYCAPEVMTKFFEIIGLRTGQQIGENLMELSSLEGFTPHDMFFLHYLTAQFIVNLDTIVRDVMVESRHASGAALQILNDHIDLTDELKNKLDTEIKVLGEIVNIFPGPKHPDPEQVDTVDPVD